MRFQTIVLPVLSSLALTLSVFFCLPILGMVCMVPLLFSLQSIPKKQYFQQALIFSSVYSLFLFFWMLSSSTQFTGNIGYGIFGLFFSVLLFTLLFTGVFLIWRKLCKAVLNWQNIIFLAGLFVLMEVICDYVFKTLPWYSHHFGNPLIGSVYTIQLAEIGGVYILTFIVFILNGGIAYNLKEKRQFKTVAIMGVFFLCTNSLIFNLRTEQKSPENEIKINLLNANVSPVTDWESQGNEIVPKIIALSKQNKVSSVADFNVWTESVVPWTYRENDAFINSVLMNARGSQIINLIGMNTDYKNNVIFNSVYAIKDQTVLGRYDKTYPLTFMERPFKNNSTIQFANNGYQVKAGSALKPIATEKGKIGVYICNEATIATAVAELVRKGAVFLVNVSNDGWFKNTYIARQHFYYNRLRAVENRRDIAINSNCGYSGKTSANGNILMIEQSNVPTFNQITLNKTTAKTIYSYYPNAFILIITLLTTSLILIKKS